VHSGVAWVGQRIEVIIPLREAKGVHEEQKERLQLQHRRGVLTPELQLLLMPLLYCRCHRDDGDDRVAAAAAQRNQ
jgi:hypothetical protein